MSDLQRTRIEALIARHVNEGAVAGMPANEMQIRNADQARKLPPLLRAIYEIDINVRIKGVEVFPIGDYIAVNAQRDDFGELTEMTYFATDLEDGFFFIDDGGLLDCGPGAVFYVDRGMMLMDWVIPCAGDLLAFFSAVERDEKPWTGERLGETATKRLIAAIEKNSSELRLSPGVHFKDLLKARDERAIAMSWGMADLLQHVNGLAAKKTQLRIYPLEAIEGVAGTEGEDGFFGALWIGTDPYGVRLAVTTGGWNGYCADRVLRVLDDVPVTAGVPLGRLADIICFWIEEEG